MAKKIDKKKIGEHILDRQTERFGFIDVTKGLGIIFVVLSHIINQDSIVNAVIYSFHVPLFFIISGALAKPGRDFKNYLIKNTKRLLLPFVIFFLIGLLVTTCVYGLGSISIIDVFKQFIYAQPTGLNVGAIWFLACLFITSLLFFAFYRLILSRNNAVITILALGILCAVAYYLPWAEEKVGWRIPFKIDVSLMALVFYCIGFLLKDAILNPGFCRKIWHKIIIIMISGAVVFVTTYFVNGLTNLSGGIYGTNLYLYVFTAFSGSILIIVLGVIMERSRILAYIGKNSLIIFSLHTLLLIPFNFILDRFSIDNTLLISVIATVLFILIMMGICFCYNFLKKVLISKIKAKRTI